MANLNTNIGPERVQVFDQPLGTVQIAGAAISTAAFLIASAKSGAPINTATKVNSLDEFETSFGDVDDMVTGYEDGYYAVKGFFDNAGTGADVYIVNVKATTPAAADFIGSAADNTGLRALDGIDLVGLISVPGLPLEQAYLVHSAIIDYVDTTRTDFGCTLSTSFGILGIPKELNKANSDTTLITAQFLSVSGAGPYVIDIQTESTAVKATGTIEITSYSDLLETAADTIEVAGVVFTAQAGAATPGDATFQAATSNDATAASLAAQITAHATASTYVTASAAAAEVSLEAVDGGVAGNSLTLVYTDNGSVVGATVTGSGTLTGGVDGDVSLSEITAGMIVEDSGGTYTGVISAVDDTADTVTVLTDPAATFSAGDDVLIKLPSAVTYKETIINNPSRLAAWFYNPVVVLDLAAAASSGDTVNVDPVGHVAGIIARIDANIGIGGPSHAPAGIQYAGIAGIQGLALSLSERLDAPGLRLNFINRLTSFPGSGNIVFGGYTAESGTSAVFTADEQLVQVMRTLQFVKASLEPGLRRFIWENFSPATQAQVFSAIQSFLRNNSYLFPAGLPESQQFKVISVEPTQDELDKGLLRVRVQLRPNKAVRFIEVTLEFPLPSA